MRKNLWSKIIILLVMFFFVIQALSPAQELFKLYENDDNIELKSVNKISLQQLINASSLGEVVVGEILDSFHYGPGYVEHMDDSIARDLFQRSNLDLDLKENRQHGIWVVPSREANYYPHSGKHNVINKWGDTKMGIAFPTKADIHGAWFAGQGGGEGVWASSIRVIGYRNGKHTQTTDWFEDIDDIPTWFTINLQDVDRIVIEATPVFNGAGWYAMDDLTYTPKIKNEQEQSSTIVIDFEDCFFNQNLNNSDFAGLTWETGTGDFYIDQDEMPTPQKSSNVDKKEFSIKEGDSSNTRGNNPVSTPTLISNYQGVIRGDAVSWSYPPDTCGAAGPNHIVEVVNRNFAVYNKSTGEELINILLGAFLPGSNGDPRVLYDQYSDRWFIIVCDFISRIYLAVSMSDDPTGDWFKCNFIVSQGSDAGKWPDYPTLGVDEVGVYTAAYMIGGGNGMSIFALDKAPLIAPNPSLGTVVAFRELPWEGAIQPVHTFGSSEGEYFVSRSSSTTIRVRLLTDLLSTPVLTELCFVPVPSHSSPPDAPALGSTIPLDTVGHRLMNAVYRDGYIWAAHCIDVGGRAASRWYKIDVFNTTLADYGTIDDSVMYYYFPTIMVNAGGDVVMGFSGSHSGQYAAAYYTGRLANDPPGVMAPPILLKAGEASYNLIDGYGRNRWGDYSLCSLDPTNQTLWTIQEYAHSHNDSGVNRWGTWIGELAFNRPPDTPDTCYGPDEGVTGVEYIFTALTSDPDGDQIYYMFDWGDGNDSGWVGPYNSGQTGDASHVWEAVGDYPVKVKAKDDYGESNWSPEHTITIIAAPKLEIGIIRGGLFKVKTVIKNTGGIEATDVNWKITLDGGAFIGKETIGTIPSISPNDEETISSNLILGFGPTTVIVTSEIPEGSEMRDQTGYVYLFFIKITPGG
ncbi:MAG: PKD domain-containing protein [Thermoplasmatales archaeon]|nr:MAG: PKD domain-containing protein [Thermoplasmatales archaeon]